MAELKQGCCHICLQGMQHLTLASGELRITQPVPACMARPHLHHGRTIATQAALRAAVQRALGAAPVVADLKEQAGSRQISRSLEQPWERAGGKVLMNGAQESQGRVTSLWQRLFC